MKIGDTSFKQCLDDDLCPVGWQQGWLYYFGKIWAKVT